MRLLDGIYLAGSGQLGFDLTDSYDCHVYLIDGGSEAALIDAGAGVDPDPLIQRITELSQSLNLTKLILTHKHVDHAGAAATLRERFGLEVIASPHTAGVVENADETLTSLAVAKQAGVYPSDYKLLPCKVDQIVQEGDVVRVGDVTLTAIETPGHCDGHLSFVGTINGVKALFVGDTLFHGGRVVWQATYDCTVHGHVESVRKLADVDFDAFFPGHLTMSLSRGRRHVEEALNRLERLELPQHLV